MTENKNNNLNQDIERRRRPRHSRRNSHENVNTTDSSKGTRKPMDQLLDFLGATGGITIVTNGELDGSCKVPTADFAEIVKKMLVGDDKDAKSTNPDVDVRDADETEFANSFLSDLDDDEDEYYNDDLGDVLNDLLGEDVDLCPPVESLFRAMMQARPFGIDWNIDKVIKFLTNNGYTISKKRNREGNEFLVAFKEGVTKPVSDIKMTNLSKEFSSAIQDIILNWLSKIK